MIPTTTNASTFLNPGEPFAKIPTNGTPEESLFLPDTARLFLRLVPTKPVQDFRTSKDAEDLARSSKLAPLTEHTSGGTYGQNKHGAFVCFYQDGKVFQLTQLFKNRELWGIDALRIEKRTSIEGATVNIGFFPCSSLETTFINTLENYLTFARNVLEIETPLRFIGGATDVEGYRGTALSGMDCPGLVRCGGNVEKQHIVYEGVIEDYDKEVVKILRPFLEQVWQECGLKRPDKDRV